MSELPEPVAILPVPARLPRRLFSRWLVRLGLLGAVFVLLFFALRNVPLGDIARTISGLRLWQIGALLILDALIYALVTARWWFVVRTDRPALRFMPLLAVRLAVFAVSYFTLGPQVGGEPLQVLYLQRNQGLTYTRASASVMLDKLFELLGNFLLLSLGLLAAFNSGIFSGISRASLLSVPVFVALISWPLVHIVMLRSHVYPVGRLLGALGENVSKHRLARFVRAAERLAGQFCQRHPRQMLGSLLVSLLAALGTVSEYALIASFLQIHLPFWKLVTAWAGGWLSFLAPLPGGLGALEASQVGVLGVFGISAAVAVSLTLVMRGRDLLIGGIGLLLVGRAARRPQIQTT